MNRTILEEYIFGSILLLANKLQNWGDDIVNDITMKQWFLIILISKMGSRNPTLKEVAEFTGTSRQNVKKMLTQLEKKEYVKIVKSEMDARALNVSLSKKAYEHFKANENITAEASNKLFSGISDEELSITSKTVEKLLLFFGTIPMEELQ